LTVAIPGAVLLVESTPARPADAEALLQALHSSDPIPAAFDLLTAGGFSAMPAFALLEYRGQSAHYFVRGGVELEFTGPGGPQTASGAGITTWTEQLISGVTGFTACASGATAGGALPLVDGAAWAARLEYTATDATGTVAGRTAPQAQAPAQPQPQASAQPQPQASAQPQAQAQLQAPTPRTAAEETLLPTAIDEETIVTPLPAVAAAAATAEVPEDSLPFPEGTTGYDHLFGVTVMKSVEAAAVRPHEEDEEPEAQASVAPSSTTDVGDHDGLTMMSGDIVELRKRAQAAKGAPSAPAPAEQREREPQFRIEFPDGRSELLDRPVIVGRSPSANKVSGAELPRLVTVGGSDPDISRSHVRFTVEGGTVVITDLHSRNGTLMSLPGRPPQKLREGEPTSALAGTVVDLGGGIRITVTDSAAAS
jgi:hypothetical protein